MADDSHEMSRLTLYAIIIIVMIVIIIIMIIHVVIIMSSAAADVIGALRGNSMLCRHCNYLSVEYFK